MEKKKRRRSIRNLRRQSINCFCEDSDIPSNNDSLLALTITDGGISPNVLGTVWLESQEESLKEKRKKRRSSMLFQKPILKIDYCSPEIETLRHDSIVPSPQMFMPSQDLIEVDAKVSPVFMTPDRSLIVSNRFDISTNSLDVDELTTPVLSHLNTSLKKVYPVTPDVGFDFLDGSPMLDITSPSLTSFINFDFDTPRTAFSDDQKTMVDHQENTDHFSEESQTDLLSSANQRPDNDNCISNINKVENLNNSCENIIEDNENLLISQIKPINSYISPSNHLTNSPLSEQLHDIPMTRSTPVTSNNSFTVPQKEIIQKESKLSEESDETTEKVISPSFVDNLTSGAMGLFNSLVRKISIKRRKSQKKTPKRLKKDNKNVETYISKSTIIIDECLSEMKPLTEETKDEDRILDSLLVKELVSTYTHSSNDTDNNQAMDVESIHTNTVHNGSGSIVNNYFSAVQESNEAITGQINSVLCVEMIEREPDNFNMKSLADSIDSSKENQITKRKSKRRSTELHLINYCEASGTDIDDADEAGVRKSRRNRRKSLEIYQAGLNFENTQPVKKFMSRIMKSNSPEQEENVEEIYLNKNFRAPAEKTWETIYESPNKAKQFVSKKRFRRVIDFEGFAPAKFKRRLQKAHKNGWNEFCSKSLTDDFVQSKLSDLYTYLDTSLES